jgi:hypothetical protein
MNVVGVSNDKSFAGLILKPLPRRIVLSGAELERCSTSHRAAAA